ncbi:hypothetical protein [Nocardia tengchongensis]|uniref:hypothetical protein n=1 Tax=Nocardia tengchongensis TaxID=2055889 RepID=UPI00367E020F
MAFRVIAPLVHLAGVEVPHAYQGKILKTIPDPVQREHLLRLGMVEEVPDPLPPGVAADVAPAAPVAAAPVASAEEPQRPAATASKDTWVAYVVAAGAATAEEAAQLTKDQLIGLVTG